MSGHKSAIKRPIFGRSDLRGDRERKRGEARHFGEIFAPQDKDDPMSLPGVLAVPFYLTCPYKDT